MEILEFPFQQVSKVTWGLLSNTEKFTSPLNGSNQTTQRPGSRWKATIEVGYMTLKRAAIMDAWLARLDGMAGRFWLTTMHRESAGGNGVILSATGRTLDVQGLVLEIGDFVEVGGELKMITGTGVPLVISPPWRKIPAVGVVVNATKPRTVMMLDSDEYSVTRLPGRVYDSIVVGCTEVIS